MSIITRILGIAGLEKRAAWSPLGLNGWPEAVGSSAVTPTTAQGVSAVYGCVQAISETIASLPLHLFRRNGDDREKATAHPLFAVLHDMANPEMTALEFREYMQACVLLRGNAFARIVRRWDGQVSELWPINPDTMQVRRTPSGLIYEYTRDGVLTRLLSHEVLHLRHRLGDDGIMGVSPIAAARGVVELAQAEADHGVNTFRNGAKLLGVLRVPGALKPEQSKAIAASWASQHGGGANSGRTAILESGVEFQPLSMSLEDASWIEARRFSLEEIARLFRVPLAMLQSSNAANYSNSVEAARHFVTITLKRHLTMWEQAISAKLLTEAGRRTYYAQHAVEGMLRGDAANRAAFYSAGIDAGWMLPSEARALEDLPSVPGIDEAPRNITSTVAAQPYPSRQ